MKRVSAEGLIPAALALRAKCRLSAKCRKRLSSCCVEEAMLRPAQYRLPIIGSNATLARRRRRSILWAQALPRGTQNRERASMSRQNYFNTLSMAQKLEQLGKCRFMDRSEFN